MYYIQHEAYSPCLDQLLKFHCQKKKKKQMKILGFNIDIK